MELFDFHPPPIPTTLHLTLMSGLDISYTSWSSNLCHRWVLFLQKAVSAMTEKAADNNGFVPVPSLPPWESPDSLVIQADQEQFK